MVFDAYVQEAWRILFLALLPGVLVGVAGLLSGLLEAVLGVRDTGLTYIARMAALVCIIMATAPGISSALLELTRATLK